MPKKIYDIKPPKVAKKTEKDLKEFFAESKKPKKQSLFSEKKETQFCLVANFCCEFY